MEQTEVLETAYLEIFDQRQAMPVSMSNAITQNALAGISGRQNSYQQSNVLKVQFNPNTLEFTAGIQREERKRFNIERNDNGEVEEADISKCMDAVTVAISLVFDRSIYQDSSVEPEVEGFLAMVQNPYVRKVAFHWGSQYYVGKIKDIKAEYKLFNRQGIPMRATVDFSIKLF